MENSKFDENTQPPTEENKTFSPEMNSIDSLRVERWKNLNEQVTQTIRKKLSENELKLIVDAHEDTEFDPTINYRAKLLKLRIMETENLEQLLQKWDVDVMMLSDNILSLSHDETTILIDWACNYWDYNNLDLEQ